MLDGIYITRLVNSRMDNFLVRIAPKLNLRLNSSTLWLSLSLSV